MGNTCRLRSDDVVPFVDPSQQDAAEVDRPDAIGHLLEADRVLLEGVGDEHKPFLEPDRPGVGDALDASHRTPPPSLGVGVQSIGGGTPSAASHHSPSPL